MIAEVRPDEFWRAVGAWDSAHGLMAMASAFIPDARRWAYVAGYRQHLPIGLTVNMYTGAERPAGPHQPAG